jgi:hypothetical protein
VIKAVVPYVPGSAVDVLACIVAQHLGAGLAGRHRRQPAGRRHHNRDAKDPCAYASGADQ